MKINLLLVLMASLVLGCQQTTNTNSTAMEGGDDAKIVSILTSYRTTQYFSPEPVSVEDITTILEAGRNAPSGHNKQDWFFSAIINQDVIKDIAGKLPKRKPRHSTNESGAEEAVKTHQKAGFGDAPAAILLACDENQKFATGLASEAMLITAESLGYGTKIMAGAARHFNEPQIFNVLQIPEGKKVVAILVIGKTNTSINIDADGVTGASTRKDFEEVATIIK